MQRLFALMLAALAGACSQPAPSTDFPYFEREGGRVRDQADILSPVTERRLATLLEQAEGKWGPQLAVVTVRSLEGYAIEDFSLQYARAWGLGDARRNDGLLLLVAPNDRQVQIEVGKGLDRTFSDEFAQTVVDRMLPAFRSGDFDSGVLAGADALVARMRAYPSRPANDNDATAAKEAAA